MVLIIRNEFSVNVFAELETKICLYLIYKPFASESRKAGWAMGGWSSGV